MIPSPAWPPRRWQSLHFPPPQLLWAVASAVAALPSTAGEEFPTGGPVSSAFLPVVGESGRGISSFYPALLPERGPLPETLYINWWMVHFISRLRCERYKNDTV